MQNPEKPKKNRTIAERTATLAMLIALAMILSWVEVLIPFNFGIPGIKLGLANLVTLIGFYLLPPSDVLIVAFSRIMLTGLLFSSPAALIYSLSGGMLSYFVMLFMKKRGNFSLLFISIFGGIFHNIGQLAAAAFQNTAILYYLPVLVLAGLLTGAINGIIAGRVLKYLSVGN